MKKILTTVLLISSLSVAAHEVYQLSQKSNVHSGSADTTVLLAGNSIEIIHENTNGFPCNFEGIYDDEDHSFVPLPISALKLSKSAKKCRVQIDHMSDETINISVNSERHCSFFCSPRASLTNSNLKLIEQ